MIFITTLFLSTVTVLLKSSSSSSSSLPANNINHPSTYLNVASAAYTDESKIQSMLGDKQRIHDEIVKRVKYWESLSSSSLDRDDHDDGVRLTHTEIQRLQEEAEELEEIQSFKPTTTTDLDLDEGSIAIIDELSESIEWYRRVGIPHTVLVPKKRKRRRRWTKKRVRVFKYANKQLKDAAVLDSSTVSDDNNYLLLNCRAFLQPQRKNQNQRQDQLHRSRFPSAPTVVVLTGWGESHIKYNVLLKSLYEEGYNVYTFDHRCQGLSSRSIRTDNPQITDIHSFDDYVADFIHIYDEVIAPTLSDGDKRISLVAHSMGCLVALKAHASMNGGLLSKAALVCPMFEPQTPFPTRFTLTLTRVLTWVGKGKKGATGEKYRGPWLPQHGITHCNVRRSAWETLRSLLPDIIVATPSFRFLREVIK